MENIASIFELNGGEFSLPFSSIAEKLKTIKAFVFDWDGVFNAGIKGENTHSTFSEADSMGTNLLRFSYWLKTGKIPFTAIITGENNLSAFKLAKREGFNTVYFGFNHKIQALEHIKQHYLIEHKEVSFCFDDVLDLSLAQKVGLRFVIRRNASPLFLEYIKNNHLGDYISANEGQNHAVREVCELILGLNNQYEAILNQRIAYNEAYQQYLSEKKVIKTEFFTIDKEKIMNCIL